MTFFTDRQTPPTFEKEEGQAAVVFAFCKVAKDDTTR